VTVHGVQHAAVARPGFRRIVTASLVSLVVLLFSGCADPGALAPRGDAVRTAPISSHHDGGTDAVCSPGPSAAAVGERGIAATTPLPPPPRTAGAEPAAPGPAPTCAPVLPATPGRTLLEAIGVSRT
jgi:hypothetical protein